MPSGKFAEDLVGKRFGKLVVIQRMDDRKGRKGVPRWMCECDCGRISRPYGISLRHGLTKSCGCLKRTVFSTTKICSKCGVEKPHADFDPIRTRNTFASLCKVCTSKYQQERYSSNPEPYRIRARIHGSVVKLETLAAYGGKCTCCGETEPVFLAIDHRNGGGGRHRKEIGKSGGQFYQWLRQHGYPDEYQVLCHNCNWGKYRGDCPHKLQGAIGLLSFGG